MTDPSARVPIADKPLSVVLPGRNVGLILEDIVTRWLEFLESRSQSYEIILVNDGSTDETATVAEKLALRHPAVYVYHHATRKGVGPSLQTGIENARCPLLFYTTCDKQFQPGDIRHFLEKINEVDMVTGYRVWQPVPWLIRAWHSVFRSVVRVLFGVPLEEPKTWLGLRGMTRRLIARWAFGVRVVDPECPFRLFRRGVFERIPIQSQGDFANIEIIAKANFLGCFMMETPVTCMPDAINEEAPFGPSFRKEFLQVFNDPDFGPVDAPEFDRVFAVETPV